MNIEHLKWIANNCRMQIMSHNAQKGLKPKIIRQTFFDVQCSPNGTEIWIRIENVILCIIWFRLSFSVLCSLLSKCPDNRNHNQAQTYAKGPGKDCFPASNNKQCNLFSFFIDKSIKISHRNVNHEMFRQRHFMTKCMQMMVKWLNGVFSDRKRSYR